MSSQELLSWTHTGAGILLFLLALASILIAVLIAVRPGADPANEKLVRRANAASRIQHLVIAVVALTGVTAASMGSRPFSEFWLWSSLVAMGFYSAALQFFTRPARMAVAEGGSEGKVGLQVALQVAHALLLMVILASMYVKPV